MKRAFRVGDRVRLIWQDPELGPWLGELEVTLVFRDAVNVMAVGGGIHGGFTSDKIRRIITNEGF